jgi:phosphohistidine swiveling domain-containing protein
MLVIGRPQEPAGEPPTAPPSRRRHRSPRPLPDRCRDHLRESVDGAGAASWSSAPPGPWVVGLDCPEALHPALVGAKAANLARLRQAHFPVLDGFVLTTAASDVVVPGTPLPDWLEVHVRPRWWALTGGGKGALVVRSSSTAEDGEDSSMAGLFTSVLDVRGWQAFVDALATVVASGRNVPAAAARPLAVLVQPMLHATMGGVLFGADPVTGRTDRRVVAAVDGGPDRLVSGDVDGAHYVLSRRGRVLATEAPLRGFGRRHRRTLCRLATRLERALGRPQDVEWAVDGDRSLVVLQARPVTALRPRSTSPRARGPVFGPGPVAETFPHALSPLEQDLWVPPLRDGLREALLLTGAAGRRAVRRSPGVVVIDGRVAVDLDLLGVSPVRRPVRAALDLRRPARRLLAAWRVGRVKAAFPALAADVVSTVDERLLAVPHLDDVPTEALLGILGRTGPLLRSVHAYEVLAGLLASRDEPVTSGTAAALWALADGRAAGLSDEEIALATPAVLALVPPRIGPPPAALPPGALAPGQAPAADDAIATWREVLRLRARWLQELSARAAWALGQRLVASGRLDDPAELRAYRLDQVGDLVGGRTVAGTEAAPEPRPPLPVAFRLDRDGEVVPLQARSAQAGRGAGGGRGSGRVHDDAGPPPPGAVLVVRTLDPGLAPMLPGLGGLIAETGSVLSHLAILAREYGVPTAVAVPDAVRRFPAGSLVTVDGRSGDVALIEEPASPSAA